MTCRPNDTDNVSSDITTTPKSDGTAARRSDRVPCTPVKYTGLVPITPMPKYDSLDTPDIRKLAKKYGIKQTLGKKKLQTKLKEVYLYNHQLSSPLSETPTKADNNQLQNPEFTLDNDECVESTSTNPSLPVETPKRTKSRLEFKSKPMRHAVAHQAKIIDLTDSDSDDAPEIETAPNQETGTCTIPDILHNTGITTDVTESSSEHFTKYPAEDTTHSYEGVSTIMPTISLLDSDSSMDSFTANKSLNFGNENSSNGSENKSGSNDFNTTKSCKLLSKDQSPSKSHVGLLIDLTVSDFSHNSMEHSISDIFEMRSPGTSKEILHNQDDIDDNHTLDNTSEKSSRQPNIEALNYNEDAKVCLDENIGLSDEDSGLYDEREKFHQSLFGSTQENTTTEGENSDGECISLFQRIMSKRTQSQTESSTKEVAGVSKSENISITDTGMNQNHNGNENDRKQPTGLSPPPKTRKIQKKVAKKSPDTKTGTSKNKSKKSKLAKENLELEMCHAIKSNSELHSQILLYRPIYFSRFKMVMKNYGIQVSSNELRDFLDSKGITFSTADENRHKGPRVAKKRRKAK